MSINLDYKVDKWWADRYEHGAVDKRLPVPSEKFYHFNKEKTSGDEDDIEYNKVMGIARGLI